MFVLTQELLRKLSSILAHLLCKTLPCWGKSLPPEHLLLLFTNGILHFLHTIICYSPLQFPDVAILQQWIEESYRHAMPTARLLYEWWSMHGNDFTVLTLDLTFMTPWFSSSWKASIIAIHHVMFQTFTSLQVLYSFDLCRSVNMIYPLWNLVLSSMLLLSLFSIHWSYYGIAGFAFIYFEDERDAEDAIRGLDDMPFGYSRRRLSVEWSRVIFPVSPTTNFP